MSKQQSYPNFTHNRATKVTYFFRPKDTNGTPKAEIKCSQSKYSSILKNIMTSINSGIDVYYVYPYGIVIDGSVFSTGEEAKLNGRLLASIMHAMAVKSIVTYKKLSEKVLSQYKNNSRGEKLTKIANAIQSLSANMSALIADIRGNESFMLEILIRRLEGANTRLYTDRFISVMSLFNEFEGSASKTISALSGIFIKNQVEPYTDLLDISYATEMDYGNYRDVAQIITDRVKSFIQDGQVIIKHAAKRVNKPPFHLSSFGIVYKEKNNRPHVAGYMYKNPTGGITISYDNINHVGPGITKVYNNLHPTKSGKKGKKVGEITTKSVKAVRLDKFLGTKLVTFIARCGRYIKTVKDMSGKWNEEFKKYEITTEHIDSIVTNITKGVFMFVDAKDDETRAKYVTLFIQKFTEGISGDTDTEEFKGWDNVIAKAVPSGENPAGNKDDNDDRGGNPSPPLSNFFPAEPVENPFRRDKEEKEENSSTGGIATSTTLDGSGLSSNNYDW